MDAAALNRKLDNPSAVILYVYLASVGGGTHTLDALASATGLSKRTVQRCVIFLVEQGMIKVRDTEAPTPTHYTVTKIR